jgi:hypothetical protein
MRPLKVPPSTPRRLDSAWTGMHVAKRDYVTLGGVINVFAPTPPESGGGGAMHVAANRGAMLATGTRPLPLATQEGPNKHATSSPNRFPHTQESDLAIKNVGSFGGTYPEGPSS